MVEFTLNYIIIPLAVLGFVIFVHEMGHFLMARYYKISAPIFSVGFGREIFGFTDKHGTRWKLSAFPLGGYVSVHTTDNDAIYKRSLVAFAGPLANFILALVMMIALVNISGIPKTPPDIVAVTLTGGAYDAGILPRDKILSLDGTTIPYYMDEIGDILKNAKNDYIDAKILRNGIEKTIPLQIHDVPRSNDFGEQHNKKMMGVVFAGSNFGLVAINNVAGKNTEGDSALARSEIIKHFGKNIVINFGVGAEREDFLIYVDPALNKGLLDEHDPKYTTLRLWDETRVEFRSVPFFESIESAFSLVYEACKKTLGVIYQIIVGKKDTGDLGGVVELSSMTGHVAEHAKIVGPYFMFRLIALLSINIGFINLLPLPMLDGGHLTLHAIEAVRGKPLTPKIKGYVYGVGIMFIIILSIIVTIRDIMDKIQS